MQGFKLAIQMLPLTPEQLVQSNEAISSLDTYFAELIARRRASRTRRTTC